MNTVGMYGDMQGIIGSSLPEIRMLDLETVAGVRDVEPVDDEITYGRMAPMPNR